MDNMSICFHVVLSSIFRLKFGAADAQFHPSDPNRLATCTLFGNLHVHDLNKLGRGSLQKTECTPFCGKIHKVIWTPGAATGTAGAHCVMAAAHDGSSYLWDTRGSSYQEFFKCGSKSDTLNIQVSPCNPRVIATSHKGGKVNIWDIRRPNTPFIVLTAGASTTASNPITCIDWHPAIPNVIATAGGRELPIMIWNLTADAAAQHPGVVAIPGAAK